MQLDRPPLDLGAQVLAAPRTAVGTNGTLTILPYDNFNGTARLALARTFPDGGTLQLAGPLLANTNTTAALVAADVAWNGTRYLAVWIDGRSGNSDVWGQYLDAAGAPMAPAFPIATRPGIQREVRVASDGAAFLVVAIRSGQRPLPPIPD